MSDDRAPASQALPDYDNPPLTELAVGVQFQSLNGWQTKHVGEFWVEIAKEFPITEDQTPIFEFDGAPRFEIRQLPPLRRTEEEFGNKISQL